MKSDGKHHYKSHHNSLQYPHQSGSKKKLQRTSTRITNSMQIMTEILQKDKQLQFDQYPEIDVPSPMQSSQQAQSVQVKYLSYLAQIIDSAPQGSDSLLLQQHYDNSAYWYAVYQSAIYVKKDSYRTNIDDNLILQLFHQYLTQGKIHPLPKNTLGQQLITNGYFLSAYAIATARTRNSPFIFKYLMQYFVNQLTIETNSQQLNYLIQNFIHQDKTNLILHLKNQQNTPGQQRQNQSQSNNKNHNQINKNINQNNQSPVRRAHLQPVSDLHSQYSKTINLDDFSADDFT